MYDALELYQLADASFISLNPNGLIAAVSAYTYPSSFMAGQTLRLHSGDIIIMPKP